MRQLPRPWLPKKEAREKEPAKMKTRKRSDDLYHTHRWTRASRVFREANPLCALCLTRDKYTPTEVVDHIIPSEVCEDFWDKENWQPLCRKCNNHKGRTTDKKIIANHKRK